MEWRPIESAPREVEDSLLLSAVDEDGERYVVVAFWQPPLAGEWPEGAWLLSPTSGNHQVAATPTHWMPLDVLPDPPLSTKRQRG